MLILILYFVFFKLSVFGSSLSFGEERWVEALNLQTGMIAKMPNKAQLLQVRWRSSWQDVKEDIEEITVKWYVGYFKRKTPGCNSNSN